ncbi:MAG: hypothetical protein PVH92_00245 [Anaerolineales bacterium]|jgi:hypothetical protein
MRRSALLLVLVILLAVLAVGTVGAQDSASIESIEVALWPEYDRPAILGLYLIRLEPDTDFPAVVSLPLPDGVNEPHVVAAWFPDGRLDDSVEWLVESQAGQQVVTVTVETTGVWLEFYAPLERQDSERIFNFQWPGGLSAGEFRFEVMHPVGSSEVVIQPSGQTADDQDGLTYTRLDLGRLNPEDKPEVSLRYSKPESAPQTPIQPPDMSMPLTLLEVALWPEFDRQDVLVIYRVQLPPETQLPATVMLPIPAEAGEPHAVATIGEDRNLYVASFDVQQAGPWSWVSVESDSLLLQIEFYSDLSIAGNQRAFTYYWPGGVSIDSFQFEVQRPPSASTFRLTPAGAAQVAQDGLTYTRAALGPQDAADLIEVSFAYDKSDDALSIDAVAQQPTLERPTTTQGGTPDLTELLPWILGGFGLLLAGIGLFMLLRMRSARTSTRVPRRRKRRSSDKDKLESSPIYCHVCGSQASASDLYCRRCGAKLRN